MIVLPRKNEEKQNFFNRVFFNDKLCSEIPNDSSRKRFIEHLFEQKDMNVERIVAPFIEKKAVTETGEFEGYGSTFGNVDFGNDVIAKGAFTESLAEWGQKMQLPLMPWFHDMKMPVGDWLEMREDEQGLFVKGKLWIGEKQIESSKMVHNLLTGTGPKGMSIGFKSLESSYEEKEIDGRSQTIRVIKKAQLYELSVVPFGMNPNATVTQAKSLVDEEGEIKDIRACEKILRDAGLSKKQANTLLSSGYKALVGDSQAVVADAKGNESKSDSLTQEQANELVKKINILSQILKG